MIHCITIDDEPLTLELLIDNISKVPYLRLVAACENALEAMKIINHKPLISYFWLYKCPALLVCSLYKA